MEPFTVSLILMAFQVILTGVVSWFGWVKRQDRLKAEKHDGQLSSQGNELMAHNQRLERLEERHVTEHQVHEIVNKSYKDLVDKMDKMEMDIGESLDDIKATLQAILIQQAQETGYRKGQQEHKRIEE